MHRMLPPRLRPVALALIAFAIGLGASEARAPSISFVPLVETNTTVMDEPIVYPPGKAKITTGIVTMPPGAKTGWHIHPLPLTGLMLSGELTVDYGDRGKRIYREGDSLVETMAVPHQGENTGTTPVKLFVVYIGAEGMPNATPVEKKSP
jgi:quercetin dioxygenase-like cupin family protein